MEPKISIGSTLIEIEVNDTSYTCSFGSQSIEAESNAKVNSRLSSDGVTFSTTIDATSEDAFLFFCTIATRGE